MFIGGDSKTVRILLDSGQVSEIPLDDAVAVEFSPRKPPLRPARQAGRREAGRSDCPPAAPSPAAAPKPVTVPAGTMLNVG